MQTLEHFIQVTGYHQVEMLDGSRYKAIVGFAFSTAIISGDLHVDGYDERWCYKSMHECKQAFNAWNGDGEPDGWFRHPASGRRRPDGDASREYINP